MSILYVIISTFVFQSLVVARRVPVALSDVRVLALQAGKFTATGGRSSPIPQLKCVGGSGGCYGSDLPRNVLCKNKGMDGIDAIWECTVNRISTKYELGEVQVLCEGFNYPEDPNILQGSCGLEYHLELTAEGRRNQGVSSTGISWFWIGVVCLGSYFFYQKFMASPARDDRPPPYNPDVDRSNDSRPPPNNRSSGPSTGSWFGSGGPSMGSWFGPRRSSSGPGFWSGLGTGGLMGYMMGSRGRRGRAMATGLAMGLDGGAHLMGLRLGVLVRLTLPRALARLLQPIRRHHTEQHVAGDRSIENVH
eukprot:1128530_1